MIVSPIRNGIGRAGANMGTEENDCQQATEGDHGVAPEDNTPVLHHGHGGEEDDSDEDDMYEPRHIQVSRKKTPSGNTAEQEQRGTEVRILFDPVSSAGIDCLYPNPEKVNNEDRGKKIVPDQCVGSSEEAKVNPSSVITVEGGESSGKVVKESSVVNRKPVFRPFENYRDHSSSSSGYYDSDHGLLSTSECYRLWKKQMMKECVDNMSTEDDKSA